MSNLVINIPLSRGNKKRSCISCVHCPVLIDENGNEIKHDSDEIAHFIRETYVKPLDNEDHSTLNDKIILRAKDKGCACPNTDLLTICKDAILTYKLKYYPEGTLPYKENSFLFGKNILRLIETIVQEDGTLSDVYSRVDVCPGHELKDIYKTQV